jgi:Flp pilus assembly protein TadD
MYPNSLAVHFQLGWSYIYNGMAEEALEEFQKAIELSGDPADPSLLGPLGVAHAASGKSEKAHQILTRLRELSEQRYVSPSEFATVHLALGDKNRALAYLEKGYEERSSYLTYLKADPFLDPLRDDPRFQSLLRRLNFPE